MEPVKDPFEWVGKTIDEQFTVEEVVGEGGFAVVYRGHHKGFDEKIAIKALKFPAKLGEEERARFLESFKAEGKLLRKLSSADASIVQALDVGAATSPNGTWTPYLVLEWLEGETLDADLKARAKAGTAGRSLGDAITLLDPVAKGLATAHGMNVAHRDVKPANLFLKTSTTTDGEKRSLKIVDFGIAKVMSDSEDVMKAYEQTGESIHAFSPRYGAPEQFARKYGATGPWTDVFALALVLIEVVAGKSAMKGDTSQLMSTATDGVTRPTLRTLGVIESDAVEAVLTKALAVEAVDRYRDAGKFWADLREAASKGDTVLSERSETLDETRKEGGDSTAGKSDTKKSAAPTEPISAAARAGQLAVAAVLFVVGAGALYIVVPAGGFSAVAPVPSEVVVPKQSDLALMPSAEPAVVPANATLASVSGFVRYTNTKFNFVIDIPNDFTTFQETQAGDGRIYTNAAGDARLQVFGGLLVGSLQDMYKAEYETGEVERWVFPAHTVTDDMFAITGFVRTVPFMEKVMVTGGIYGKLLVSYPEEATGKAHFEEVLQHTRDSFSFTAASSTTPLPLDAGMAPSDAGTKADAGAPPRGTSSSQSHLPKK